MKTEKSDFSAYPGPSSTTLDPSHPNYDAILLRRSRLEAHRRRRLENKGLLTPVDQREPGRKAGKKPARTKKS